MSKFNSMLDIETQNIRIKAKLEINLKCHLLYDKSKLIFSVFSLFSAHICRVRAKKVQILLTCYQG